ncbi:unnamed protein product [Prunus armeniaca]
MEPPELDLQAELYMGTSILGNRLADKFKGFSKVAVCRCLYSSRIAEERFGKTNMFSQYKRTTYVVDPYPSLS